MMSGQVMPRPMGQTLRRLGSALRLDLRLQIRQHMVTVTAVLGVVLGLALRFLAPETFLQQWLPVLMVMGLGSTGFLFAGSLLLSDAQHRTVDAIRVSPIRWREWVASKALTLTALGLLETSLWIVLSGAMEWVRPLPLLLGVILLTLPFVFWGLILAVGQGDLTELLLPGGFIFLCSAPLPVLHHLGLWTSDSMYAWPFQAPMLLLAAGFGKTLSVGQWFYAVGVGSLAAGLSGWLALRRLQHNEPGMGRTEPKASTRSEASRQGDLGLSNPTRRPKAAKPTVGWRHSARFDLQRLLRDRFLVFIGLFSTALIGIMAWALPWMSDFTLRTWNVDLVPYYPLIAGYFVVMMGIFPGFLCGFVLIQEREHGTLSALRVMPMSTGTWLMQKLLWPSLLSVALTILAGAALNPLGLGWGQVLAIGLASSSVAAFGAVSMATLARNKVQGVNAMKMLNSIGVVPAAAWFVPEPWQFLAGLFPPYWLAKGYWAMAAGEAGAWAFLLLGWGGGLVTTWLMAGLYQRRLQRLGVH